MADGEWRLWFVRACMGAVNRRKGATLSACAMRYAVSLFAALLCAELNRALDGLYVQLKALLTDLDLAKPEK